MSNKPVVVGVDGSPGAATAIDVAATEAALRGTDLNLVYASNRWLSHIPGSGSGFYPAAIQPHAHADRILDSALRQAAAHPHRVVNPVFAPLRPSEALIEASEKASLVVVGHRERGDVASRVFGSVGEQVGTYARCPTLIVRAGGVPDAPIVAGFDGPSSRGALEFAFAEAAFRDAPLLALHVWTVASAGDPSDALNRVRARDAQEAAFLAALHLLREQYRNVRVDSRILDGRPREQLIEASRAASLLVLGRRGLGGFRELLIGSTSQGLIRHAHCPVAVVG